MKSKGLLVIAFLMSLPVLVAIMNIQSVAAATVIVYGDNFNVYFATNEVLSFGDSYIPYKLFINTTSGNLNLTSCYLTIYDNEQGNFRFTARESCVINVSSSVSNTRLYLNNWLWTGVTSIVSGNTYALKWVFPLAPKTSVLLIHSSVYGTSTPLSGSYEYLKGTKLSITATPISDDYSFGYWIVNGVNKTFNPLSLTLSVNTELTPVYKVENNSGVYYLLGDLFPSTLWLPIMDVNQSGYLFTTILSPSGASSDYAIIHDTLTSTSPALYISDAYSPYNFISVGQNWHNATPYTWLNSYGISRGYFYFDTSAIPKGVEIINVTLHFYARWDSTFDHPTEFIVQTGMPNSPSVNLKTTDYNEQLYSGNYGHVTSNTLNLSAYNILRLENKTLLNAGGITKFILRCEDDIHDVVPTDYIGLIIPNIYNQTAVLEVKYSADAELIFQTNLPDAPIFVNNEFIHYGNFTYAVPPNNKTLNPHYTVSFGHMEGYITPKPVTVTLGYGGIGVVTGIYRTISVDPSLGGFSFSMIASGIFIPGILIGVISGGFYIAGRKLHHEWAAALIGAALALGLMGYYQVVPIAVIGLIYAVGGFLIYYLWWKRRT